MSSPGWLNLPWDRERMEREWNPKAELWIRAGAWLLFTSFVIPDASRVAIEMMQSPSLELSPPPALGFGVQLRRWHLPPLAAPRPLWMDLHSFFFPQTNHRTPALLPPGTSALPCCLWRHFSALLRDVFKASLFLFIVGSWKPFPGRASALCAWDRGELSLSSGACNPCPSPAEREIPNLQITF